MRLLRLPAEELLLRAGLALAFLYPPFSALQDPYSWIGYFPTFLLDFVAPHSLLLLHAFGVVEVVLALWVLLGKRVFIPAALMAVMLVAIVLMNPVQFPILFRDISIAFMAGALALRHRPSTHGR